MICNKLFELPLQTADWAIVALVLAFAMQLRPPLHLLLVRCRIDIQVIRD